MTNDNYYVQGAGIETVPTSTAGTGTITSTGRQITGTGTLFTTELSRYSWVFDATNNKEVRRVMSIKSDTVCYVDEAFSVDIAVAQAYSIVKRPAMTNIGIGIPTGATGNINNSAVTEQTVINFCAADNVNASQAFVNPVVLEVTGGTFIITTQR